jgi:hypothetical protein
MDCFPHPAHSPDLAPSDYHLFGPVKDALYERRFADGNELKHSFVTSSEVEAGNFTIMVYGVLLNVGKSALKMMKTLWENSLTIAKVVCMIHINFIFIAITSSEKKLEALLSYRPS